MTHCGAITVPVQPAADSSEPSPSPSQAATMNAIDGQSAIAASWPPTMLAWALTGGLAPAAAGTARASSRMMMGRMRLDTGRPYGRPRERASGITPRTDPLERRAGGDHGGVGAAAPRDLHAHREAVHGAGRDRRGGVARHVRDVGEAPADQRVDRDALDLVR